MKILVAEDDFTSRLLLEKILSPYGVVHGAVNGREAVDAYRMSLDAGTPFELICLDIMMPDMNGHEALKEIRRIEDAYRIAVGKGSKIIMTTALDDADNIFSAFRGLCDAYMVKPINKGKLLQHLKKFGLLDKN
jgi:two-component system, chemotaxis family, chemotaxis protein CheY